MKEISIESGVCYLQSCIRLGLRSVAAKITANMWEIIQLLSFVTAIIQRIFIYNHATGQNTNHSSAKLALIFSRIEQKPT